MGWGSTRTRGYPQPVHDIDRLVGTTLVHDDDLKLAFGLPNADPTADAIVRAELYAGMTMENFGPAPAFTVTWSLYDLVRERFR